LLLVRARVQITDLAGEFGRDDAIGGEEGICEGGLAVIDVGEDTYLREVLENHVLVYVGKLM